MKKMFDVTSVGELLIDFTPAGVSDTGMALYERNAGGGPPNSLAAITKQGGSTAFIGKVGTDAFGHFLEETLTELGINTDGLLYDPVFRTTLAMVSLDDDGERSFDFYRNPSADLNLHKEEVDTTLIENSSLFYFSSQTLTHTPARQATEFGVKFAKENNIRIGFDPNIRPLLWDNKEEARKVIVDFLPYCDVLRIGKDEYEFLFEEKVSDAAAFQLLERYDIGFLFITDGAKGATYYHQNLTGHLPTYKVDVVDTTGSGDAFTGTIVYEIAKLSAEEFENLPKEELEKITKLGNACGALAATKMGGVASMPTREEMLDCIEHTPYL